MAIKLNPIGYIHSKYRSLAEVPPSSRMNRERGELHLYKKYAAGLKDLSGFSHLLIIFCFHKQKGDFDLIVHPRPRQDLEVGLFSTHSPRRPNPIGVSVVELMSVRGNIVYFRGLDMLDRTPVLDIKPISADIKIDKSGWLANRRHKP